MHFNSILIYLFGNSNLTETKTVFKTYFTISLFKFGAFELNK